MRLLIALSVVLHAAIVQGGDYPERAQDETIVETVLRLENFDLRASERAQAAVTRYLHHNPGSEKFFELVRKYKPDQARPMLLELAAERSGETAGVEAARLLLEMGEKELLQGSIDAGDAAAAGIVAALGLSGRPEAVELVRPLLTDARRPLAVRSAAAAAVGRARDGHRELLELVLGGRLPDDLHFTVGNILRASGDAAIREAAAEHLPLPATADAKPLPPLADLVKRSGNASNGRELFFTKATCSKCHKVHGEGKEIGPDLSEIGSKLSREAMFVAILDPSAGISHNYETYQAILEDGTIFSGIKLSETDAAVTLRSAEGIDRTILKAELDELVQQKVSLMPADLQKLMTADELIDVVAYLTTLKKQEGP